MVRIGSHILALIGATLIGSAAVAQSGAGFYSVTLASQPASSKQVVRGMVFNCDGASCVAGEGTSRPAIVCASVARELGPVATFRAGDTTLDGEALAKCNAKADTTKIARR